MLCAVPANLASLAPRIGILLVAIASCQRDSQPLERLSAGPQPAGVANITAVPSPPPPPPRGDEPTPPPDAVAVLAHRDHCRVRIDRVAETPARSAELVARLVRDESWSNGVVGCVSNAPYKIAIDCVGASTTFSDSCGNIFDANDKQLGTWSEGMIDWFIAWHRR
jgi:hypothetical protein